MEMIELYVKEVGRHLPEKMRSDIEQEIRSTIEDTLEDESRQQGRPVDEAMVVEVLKRMGPPRKVEAAPAGSPNGTVEIHYYDGAILEYDQVPEARVPVLGGIRVVQVKP